MRFWLFVASALFAATLNANEELQSTELYASFAPVIAAASKNVVYLESAEDTRAGIATPFAEDSWFKPYFQYPQLGLTTRKLRRSLGSGVIVSNRGLIVTSAKVAQNRATLKAIVPDFPEALDAKVLGVDQLADLAVLRVIADNLPEPIFADPSAAQTGDLIFTIGNPLGIEPVASMGVISTIGKQFESDRLFQTDLEIGGGAIGGAVINAKGELLGVASYLRGMKRTETQGGFFLPIDRVKAIAERIERSGAAKEAWLGIAVADLTPETKSYFGREEGVLITAVEGHSPAENAGLKRGDLILLADNVALGSVADFERLLSTIVADRELAFLFLRDRKLSEAFLRVGRLEISSGNAVSRTFYYQGLTLETLTSTWRERLGLTDDLLGATVVDMDAASLAAKSGFETGDVIVQIDGREIESLTQLQETIAKKPPSVFSVVRGGLVVNLNLTSER
ncbi:MAG: PDZ domain-containing protein [Helicobacteraceae bacterium]|jgi:serine protease Do|nr:PDZ domain-containing protein [Helicobacteraceae bacterium]